MLYPYLLVLCHIWVDFNLDWEQLLLEIWSRHHHQRRWSDSSGIQTRSRTSYWGHCHAYYHKQASLFGFHNSPRSTQYLLVHWICWHKHHQACYRFYLSLLLPAIFNHTRTWGDGYSKISMKRVQTLLIYLPNLSEHQISPTSTVCMTHSIIEKQGIVEEVTLLNTLTIYHKMDSNTMPIQIVYDSSSIRWPSLNDCLTVEPSFISNLCVIYWYILSLCFWFQQRYKRHSCMESCTPMTGIFCGHLHQSIPQINLLLTILLFFFLDHLVHIYACSSNISVRLVHQSHKIRMNMKETCYLSGYDTED